MFLRYFNYRTTQYLASEGFYEFHNWFDDRAWYPLGRIIGGTIYPGKSIQILYIFYTISLCGKLILIKEGFKDNLCQNKFIV